MKLIITSIVLTFCLTVQAQLNQKTAFGNLCALGNSIQIQKDTIHIAGTTCLDIGNSQFSTSAFIAGYNLMGNLLYYKQVGDTLRGYRGEKLLIDSIGYKYILGTFSNDSSNNPTNIGVFVQKQSPNNQVLWTSEYQDTSSNVYYFMRNGVLLENGNIAICGTYNTSSPIDADILFMVFDSLGNLIVHKRFGTLGFTEEARGICRYDENRVVLGASKFSSPNGNNWVLMLDNQGNMLNEYISTSNRRVGVWDIVKTKDGGLASASAATNGSFPSPDNKSYVEKLDSNLIQVWDYTLNTFFSDWNISTSIDEDPNGNLIIGGNYGGYEDLNDTIPYNAFLLKLNESGDSSWHKQYRFYQQVNYVEFHNVYDLTNYNDRIYFVGDANDFNNPIPPGQSMWLVSTDSNGIISNLQMDFAEQIQILVYPNPTKDLLNIQFDHSSGEASFKLYDLQGRLQFNQVLEREESTISLTGLPKGLYIFEIRDGIRVSRGKVLKE